MYNEYLKYVLEHKKNVFIECIKDGLYLHAFTHDLSKFKPSEFKAYAKYFHGPHGIKLNESYPVEQLKDGKSCLSRYYLKCKTDFEKAWLSHYVNNKHHWNHWAFDIYGEKLIEPRFMPEKYIKQMICDWKGMSRKFGGSATLFYLNNIHNIILHRDSAIILERLLGLHEYYDSKYTLKEFSQSPVCHYIDVIDSIKYSETEKINRGKYTNSNGVAL